MRTKAIRHALSAARTGLLESELDLDGLCDMAIAELDELERSLSELEEKDAERIAIGKALGWLMEASEDNLDSGDDEFNEAWLNAESVMCDMSQGAFLSLEELEEIEWGASVPYHMPPPKRVRGCPICHYAKCNGHSDNCWLVAKIKQAKGE